MAQTQQRAGAKPATPPTEADKLQPEATEKPQSTEDRLTEIEARLAWIEANTPGLPARETAEADQVARDDEILSRRPNTYEEAVAFEAAQQRRDERRRAAKPADGEESRTED